MVAAEIQTQTLIVLLNAMVMVESGGNQYAYNEQEQAVGILQVRQPVVDDLNRFYGDKFDEELKLGDFYSPVLSRWAVLHYARMYDNSGSAEEIARCWNGGPDGPEEACTIDYWLQVKKLMERQGVVGFHKQN